LGSRAPRRRFEMVDPVCGMTVEPETAAAAWEHGDEVYYFCSVGCMERFREDPERFLSMDPSERSM
jgi:P-type Cu+ transporter